MVLEATCQVILLRPGFRNVGKRLVKTPKVHFADVRTLCYLAGLKDAKHAMSGPMGGAIFETAVVGEMARRLSGRGELPALIGGLGSSTRRLRLRLRLRRRRSRSRSR